MRQAFGLIQRRSAAEKNRKKLLVSHVQNLFKAFSLREPAHKALPARGKPHRKFRETRLAAFFKKRSYYMYPDIFLYKYSLFLAFSLLNDRHLATASEEMVWATYSV